MSTFAAANIGARPALHARKKHAHLDEEAKIFLIGELSVSLVAAIMAALSWFVAANYARPWLLWEAWMLLVVAAWPIYLVVRAWAAHLLSAVDDAGDSAEYGVTCD